MKELAKRIFYGLPCFVAIAIVVGSVVTFLQVLKRVCRDIGSWLEV